MQKQIIISIFLFHYCFGGSYTFLNDSLKERLYDLLADVVHTFDEHEVVYWAAHNTTLGAIRHGGIIPWQKARLGLNIFECDENKMLSLRDCLVQQDLAIIKHMPGWYKIYFLNSTVFDPYIKNPCWFFSVPNINIYCMKKIGDCYCFSTPFLRQSLARYFFYEHEVQLPFVRSVFGPIMIPIAHNADQILARTYGNNWLLYPIYCK